MLSAMVLWRMAMDHFLYRDGALHSEDVPLSEIAATVGSPFYCYSSATLLRHYRLFDDALAGMPHLVCYAMKAASNQAILKLLGDAGAGMDVVSGGEYMRARAVGVPGSKIVFSGVGKTPEEMRLALSEGIRQFNVESEPELRLLSMVATSMDATAPITIRVNPDVDARTHAKIATGKSENKFGIPISKARAVYAEAAALPGLEVVGVDVHIGSQLTDLDPYRDAFEKASMSNLGPNKLENTMSFMFETRFPQHLTAFAAKEAPLQDDYIDCWTSLEKKFDGTPGRK